MIRPADPADAEDMRAVERAAGVRFLDVGMPEIATDEPMSADRLAAYARSGRSWVATDEDSQVVGYVVVDVIDGCAHIEQISVEPTHQGRGMCRALIDEVEGWAADREIVAMTLTTFRDVSWNRPLYQHLGFRVLCEEELTPGLLGLRAEEAAHGLDPRSRVCMRRAVSLKLIPARLGHSSETLVLTTYGHLQPADREAAEALWDVTRRLQGTDEGTAG